MFSHASVGKGNGSEQVVCAEYKNEEEALLHKDRWQGNDLGYLPYFMSWDRKKGGGNERKVS